jgi:hypothetical protein
MGILRLPNRQPEVLPDVQRWGCGSSHANQPLGKMVLTGCERRGGYPISVRYLVHCGCLERVEQTYVNQRSGHSFRVKVAVERLTKRIVNVSPNAFSRLKNQDGGEPTEEYHQAAISGAMSALSDADTGGAVTILEVDYEPAHTTPDDVRVSTLVATSMGVRKMMGR